MIDLSGHIPIKKTAEILEVSRRRVVAICKDPIEREKLGAVLKTEGQKEWWFKKTLVKSYKKRPAGRPKKLKADNEGEQLSFKDLQ